MSVVEIKGHLYPRGNAYECHVHGVTFGNDEGSSRQRIIARLWVRDALCLVREPHNPSDPNAIRVDSRHGVLGYIPATQAHEIAVKLDAGKTPNVFVQWLAGGTHDRPTRGVGVIVDFDTPASADTPPPRLATKFGLLARLASFLRGR